MLGDLKNALIYFFKALTFIGILHSKYFLKRWLVHRLLYLLYSPHLFWNMPLLWRTWQDSWTTSYSECSRLCFCFRKWRFLFKASHLRLVYLFLNRSFRFHCIYKSTIIIQAQKTLYYRQVGVSQPEQTENDHWLWYSQPILKFILRLVLRLVKQEIA